MMTSLSRKKASTIDNSINFNHPFQSIDSRDYQHPRENSKSPYLSSSTDPLILLPPEIISIIFNSLSFKDLLQCISVSKTWNYILSNQTCIWINHIDIRNYNYGVMPSPQTFLKYLSLGYPGDITITEANLDFSYNKIVYTISVSNFKHKRNKILVNQPSSLQQNILIMYLPLQQTNLTKISINIPLIDLSVFVNILNSFPHLQYINISDFKFTKSTLNSYQLTNHTTNLKQLILCRTDYSSDQEDIIISTILQSSPSLTTLEISLIHSQNLLQVISNITSLKRLLLRYLNQTQVDIPPLNTPHLEELFLRAWSFNITSTPSNLNHLKTLDILCDCYAHGRTFSTLLTYYNCWATIESLQLISNKTWNKQDLKLICNNSPHLQQITLWCEDVSLPDILEISIKAVNLYLINVNPRYEIFPDQMGYSEYHNNNWIQKNILNYSVIFERSQTRRHTV